MNKIAMTQKQQIILIAFCYTCRQTCSKTAIRQTCYDYRNFSNAELQRVKREDFFLYKACIWRVCVQGTQPVKSLQVLA